MRNRCTKTYAECLCSICRNAVICEDSVGAITLHT